MALRNAGFGLQFSIAGEDFPENAPEGLPESPSPEEYTVEEPAPKELTLEEKLKQAMDVACPISKFKGKTLGEVLQLDPKAIMWVAEKFTGSEEIKSAAQFIRDCALEQASA